MTCVGSQRRKKTPIQLQLTRGQVLYILDNIIFYSKGVNEDLLLVQKLLEQFLMKRKLSDDEIYSHLAILLNKLQLLL